MTAPLAAKSELIRVLDFENPAVQDLFRDMQLRYFDAFCKAETIEERTKIAYKMDMLRDFEQEIQAVLNMTEEVK